VGCEWAFGKFRSGRGWPQPGASPGLLTGLSADAYHPVPCLSAPPSQPVTSGAASQATSTSPAGKLSATSLLAAAQRAVDRAGSFELAVQGHNYVLPQ
jgi:hypothetical protein